MGGSWLLRAHSLRNRRAVNEHHPALERGGAAYLMYLGQIGSLTFTIAFAHQQRRLTRCPADRSIVIG